LSIHLLFGHFLHDVPQTPTMPGVGKYNNNSIFHGFALVSYDAIWCLVTHAPQPALK